VPPDVRVVGTITAEKPAKGWGALEETVGPAVSADAAVLHPTLRPAVSDASDFAALGNVNDTAKEDTVVTRPELERAAGVDDDEHVSRVSHVHSLHDVAAARKREQEWEDGADEVDGPELLRERAAAAVLAGDADTSMLTASETAPTARDGGSDAGINRGGDSNANADADANAGIADDADGAAPAALAQTRAERTAEQCTAAPEERGRDPDPARTHPAQAPAHVTPRRDLYDLLEGCDGSESPEVVIRAKVFKAKPKAKQISKPPAPPRVPVEEAADAAAPHPPLPAPPPSPPSQASPTPHSPPPAKYVGRIDPGGPLTLQAYQQRLVTSDGPQEVKVGGATTPNAWS
jgi:hypothetical protein